MKKILSAALALVCIWFATPARAALPYGYTQLEYIESTGTQYIDTNIPNSDKLKSWIDFSDVSAEQGTLFGGTTGVNGIEFAGNTYGWMARLKDKAFVNAEILNNTTFSDTITLTQNSITSKNFQSSWRLRADTNSVSGTMRVFVKVKGNLHGYKLWTNDELVFDGIPAKRNSDGAIGLYDKVTGNLFISKGSESFVAGPETCDGTAVNYTSATGTVSQSGTPTPDNPIEPTFYKQGNMVLRKVGDYADSYDASTGKITRRVGVKVLDGTESWVGMSNNRGYFTRGGVIEANYTNVSGICTHYKFNVWQDNARSMPVNAFGFNKNASSVLTNGNITFRPDLAIYDTVEKWQQYLAAQYANGTPVTVWYPLAEETTEDWTETSYCETPIKIATTKYNETKFSPLNTALQNAISVVDTVVTQTITQAASIATLQAQKQTRPNDIADDNEKCPAGKKCLLVTDTSGIPHWYEIVERYSRLPDGYTELEYIESTGTQYIDTGIYGTEHHGMEIKFNFPTLSSTYSGRLCGGRTGTGAANAFAYIGTNLGTQAPTNNTFYVSSNNVLVADWEPVDTNVHTVSVNLSNNQKSYFDGQEIQGIGKTTAYVHQFTTNLFRAYNGSSGWADPTPARIYFCKITNSGELVRDFIPAKNPDGKIGMYDLVNGVFYENKGTGDFIGGQPVFN